MAVVRMRGLPYSATADDVLEFFAGITVRGAKCGICFPQGPNGRSNGEAYVELDNHEEVSKALALHNKHMGKRYIEIFESDEPEMNHAMGCRPDMHNRREFVVRLRGLPYDTEKPELFSFFNGLEIAPNGIGLLVDHMGRCTGDAYVQFISSEALARAKEKHLEKIGHRYIEVFDSCGMEANMAIQRQLELNQERNASSGPIMNRGPRDNFSYGGYDGYEPGYRGAYGPPSPNGNFPPYGHRQPPRPGPYARPMPPMGSGYGNRPPSPRGYGPPPMGYKSPAGMRPNMPEKESVTGHAIKMRGLPYSASQEEIANFLSPLQPVNIQIRFNASGRPTGEAYIDFASHDEAKEAMKKDREKIGSRYIELFLESTPAGNRSHMGSGGGGGGGGYNSPPRGNRPPNFGGGRPSGGMPPMGNDRGQFYDRSEYGMYDRPTEYYTGDRYPRNGERYYDGDGNHRYSQVNVPSGYEDYRGGPDAEHYW